MHRPARGRLSMRADDEHRPLQKRCRGISAPKGSIWRGAKKREEKRSTPAFFSFFAARPHLWGSQGRAAPEAGFAASQQRDFFASFLVTKRKVLKAGCCYKRLSPQGGDNRRAAHKNIKNKKKHPAVPGRVPRIRKKVGGDWLSYLPRCQMSASYSAMVRSLLNMPALAMLIRHLRRQPSGS